MTVIEGEHGRVELDPDHDRQSVIVRPSHAESRFTLEQARDIKKGLERIIRYLEDRDV